MELAIDELFDNVRAGDKLHGDWEGYRKLRAGDYQIIYAIKDENSVEIQYIRHRRRWLRALGGDKGKSLNPSGLT